MLLKYFILRVTTPKNVLAALKILQNILVASCLLRNIHEPTSHCSVSLAHVIMTSFCAENDTQHGLTAGPAHFLKRFCKPGYLPGYLPGVVPTRLEGVDVTLHNNVSDVVICKIKHLQKCFSRLRPPRHALYEIFIQKLFYM